jgi:hypothetical protein
MADGGLLRLVQGWRRRIEGDLWSREGPTIEVVLSPIDSRQGSHRVILLVDSGAEVSIVEPRFVSDIGGNPVDFMPVETMWSDPKAEKQKHPVYAVRISVPGSAMESCDIRLLAKPSAGRTGRDHGVLGRDVLRQFRFVLDGPNASFELALPVPVTSNQRKAMRKKQRR